MVYGPSVVKRPEPMAAMHVPNKVYGITKPVLETDRGENTQVSRVGSQESE